jgi:uncharacterized membrane protein YjjP (DUF1212 family)
MNAVLLFSPGALGPLLLDIGASLLQAGASSKRVSITMKRFAAVCEFESHVAVTSRAVSLTLNDENGATVYNGTHDIAGMGVNFKVISGISRLSWEFAGSKLSLEQTRSELVRIEKLPHYSRWLVLPLVALAGAAFCFTFGGGWQEMLLTFTATFLGLYLKQELVRKKFNTYIVTFLSALTAAAFTAAAFKLGLGNEVEHALSTCVLFLVPGVPLINCLTDLVDGYIINGIDRGVNALMHAMAIAFGLALALYLFSMN